MDLERGEFGLFKIPFEKYLSTYNVFLLDVRGSLKCCYRVKIFPSSIYAYREKSAESASLFLPILFRIQSQLVLIAVTVITIRNSRICKSFKTSVLHSLC